MTMAKRLFDLCFSIAFLTLFSPLLLIVAVAIELDSKGPVFFRQERVGLNGRLFKVYKFRTMVENAAEIGPNITPSNDPRITRVGAFLRKSYVDELPQLINVLKGEMSVVGPRPETPEYVALYAPDQRKVLAAKPGMAGPATIAYRNEEDILADCQDPEEFYINHMMRDRLNLDLEYIENQSLLYDFQLLAQMLRATLTR
jgi:lipopolysaccharide/colanic/teichoic acid biosynthesis glycosyltransferase